MRNYIFFTLTIFLSVLAFADDFAKPQGDSSSSGARAAQVEYKWINNLCKRFTADRTEIVSIEEAQQSGKCPAKRDYSEVQKAYGLHQLSFFPGVGSLTVMEQSDIPTVIPNLGRIVSAGGRGACSGSAVASCVLLTAKHCIREGYSFRFNDHPHFSMPSLSMSQGILTGNYVRENGPSGDWAFRSLDPAISSTAPLYPIVIRKAGKKGFGCEEKPDLNLIECPEDWNPQFENFQVFGYPVQTLDSARGRENFAPLRSPVQSSQCQSPAPHFDALGLLLHQCPVINGNSGGPATATIVLNNGQKKTAIVAVNAAQDGNWNYNVTPTLTAKEIAVLEEKIRACPKPTLVTPAPGPTPRPAPGPGLKPKPTKKSPQGSPLKPPTKLPGKWPGQQWQIEYK